jgi:hypothetical protein
MTVPARSQWRIKVGGEKKNVEGLEVYSLSLSLIVLFSRAGPDTSSSQFYIALVLPAVYIFPIKSILPW